MAMKKVRIAQSIIQKAAAVFAAVLLAIAVAAPVYAASPVTAKIPVTEEVSGGTVELRNSSGTPVSTLSISGGQTGSLEVSFDEPDTHEFTVRQIKSDTGTAMDNQSYTVQIIITEDNEGKLTAITVAYDSTGKKVDKVSFRNTKTEVKTTVTPTPTATATPTATPTPSADTKKSSETSSSADNKSNSATVSNQDEKQASRDTGDESMIAVYACLASASAAAIVAAVVFKKRKEGLEGI